MAKLIRHDVERRNAAISSRWPSRKRRKRRDRALREALAFWVDRSEDLCETLRRHEPLPTVAEISGILSDHYLLGHRVRDEVRSGR